MMARFRAGRLLIALALLTAGQLHALAAPASNTQTTRAPEIEPPRSLAVDARDGSLVKATMRGLFRSTDAGRTWKALLRSAGPGEIGQVVLNPDKPTIIYAAGISTGVVLSEDGGATWRHEATGLPTTEVQTLAIHSFRRDTLFASIRGRGVYRTENGGRQWQRMDGGPPARSILALAHSPLSGSMNTGWLYAGTPDGPYLSMDCF